MLNIRNTLPFLVFFPLAAISAEKHVHGEAEMFIAIENKQVLIELESPADNILGFEHEPKTKEQHKLLDNSIDKLKSYTSLISFSAGACKQVDVEVKAPFEDHHGEEDGHHEHHDGEHGHDKHDEHKHDKHDDEHGHEEHKEHAGHEDHEDHEDGHSEFHTSYTLACSKNVEGALTATVNAFKNFSGFEKIQVNWVTTNKQGSFKASASKTQLKIQ